MPAHTASFSDDGPDLGSVADPRSNGSPATLFHDAVGRVRAVGNALHQRTIYDYDALHKVSTVTDPRGGATAFTYDPNGNLLTVTDANSQTTSYAYDLQDRMVRRTDPLGRIDTYAYDAAGDLTTATDRRGAVTTATCNGLNRPVTAAVAVPWDAGLNRSIAYTYDALDVDEREELLHRDSVLELIEGSRTVATGTVTG